MVESAVSDIVCPAVTAKHPLAAGGDEVLEFEKLPAAVASAVLHQGDEGVADLARHLRIVAGGQPLFEECLYFGRAAVAFKTFAHQPGHSLAHAVGTEVHTQAELGIVFKERILPRRAVPFCILAERRRREGRAVNR